VCASYLLSNKLCDPQIEDREGLNPLQLLESTFLLPRPEGSLDELFTWGNNANLVLGHGDGQDRLVRIHFKFSVLCRN
jgi:hypothetical protein